MIFLLFTISQLQIIINQNSDFLVNQHFKSNSDFKIYYSTYADFQF